MVFNDAGVALFPIKLTARPPYEHIPYNRFRYPFVR
jgi:hypothetical protein